MQQTIRKFLFLCSFVPLAASSIEAQTIIKGYVSDEQQKPAGFATVRLAKTSDSTLVKTTLTSVDGNFFFEEVQSGTYLVTVEWIGYHKSVSNPFSLTIGNKEITLKNILLQPETKLLNTVNINGKKPLIETKGGKTILNVGSSILSAGNSALEILSKAPGVTVDREGNISLKGKSGVNVMINGKLTYLSAAQLATLLRSTEGNTIETIELMSSPPATYDASGSGGIINIKLKKNSNYGTNGTVTAGTGYGKFYKNNTGINFNHRTKNLNVFGSYTYTNDKEYQDLDLERSTKASNETTYFSQQGRNITKLQNNNYRAGLDYTINKKNTIGLLFNGYINNNTSNNENKTWIGNQPSKTDSSILAENTGKASFKNQSYNLNYKSVLDTSGQELSADADYSQFRSNSQTVYNNYFYNNLGQSFKTPVIYRNATPSTVKIWSGKLDYTIPFTAKTKLETGLKSSFVQTDNDFQFEDFQFNTWKNDPSRSNRFIYKENVNAAYANLNTEFNSTSLQVGLRTELTHSEGNSPTLQQIVKRNYTDLFPNLSLSQKLSDQNDIGFSYSRRIDRPDYQSLNPFLYFNDLYTYAQGNPLLNPQYTNSFEFSYSYKKILNATLGYSHTRDVITTTLITDTIKKTILIKDQNLAAQNLYNLNVSMPLTITKWWNTTNTITLFYRSFSSPDLMGASFHSGKTSYLLNTTQSFTITPTINAELSMNYQSAQVYGTYAVKPLYNMDMGLSKSFAGNRANIKVAANDVFNFMKARISSAIPGQDYQLIQKEETRVFRITFSYNFGSSLIKAVATHVNASDTEQKRVKSGN
ncbi:TonB-dependent receptor domain-containing protein [Pedobacter sp. L105]|uniref:TonB-dependent receptor domain-containing protein n=1 Tax=Pedobacter sp. L105 TaxID=1641871 RepID=UPI00131DA753|nr:TonB-dependent receptor [Pedobacter sp. L105]